MSLATAAEAVETQAFGLHSQRHHRSSVLFIGLHRLKPHQRLTQRSKRVVPTHLQTF